MSKYILRMYDYSNWSNISTSKLNNLPLSALVNDFKTDTSQKLSFWLLDDISKTNLNKLALAINSSGKTGKLYPKHFLVFENKLFQKKVLKCTEESVNSLIIDMRDKHLNSTEIDFKKFKKLISTMAKNIPRVEKVPNYYVSEQNMIDFYKDELKDNPDNLDKENPNYSNIVKKLDKLCKSQS